MRNATVSTVAPTGTISILAGVSSGIEPIFSSVMRRNVLDGKSFIELQPLLKGYFTMEEVPSNFQIREKLGECWITADEVSVIECRPFFKDIRTALFQKPLIYLSLHQF
jgi:ribonucleoside-diphosphate reductase alpha chain